MGFDWKEFFRTVLGIFLIGVGVAVGGNSNGKLLQLILGFALVAVGIGILVSK